MKKQPVFVLIKPGNNYLRSVGMVLTNHVVSEMPLDKSEIEQFRIDPVRFMEPETA